MEGELREGEATGGELRDDEASVLVAEELEVVLVLFAPGAGNPARGGAWYAIFAAEPGILGL